MNFMTQLGVLIIILVILIILIKSNQTLEKIYMEEEKERESIEIPKVQLSEVKLPKFKFGKKKPHEEEVKEEKKAVERSMSTMPVDTSSKWSVEVLDDRGRMMESRRISSFPFQIGRNEENDLVLDDLSVSSFHAKVEDTYGTLQLVDQGSLNKLLVNGRIEEAVELLSGMEVDLGNTRLRFRKEEKKANKTIAYRGSSLMEEWH